MPAQKKDGGRSAFLYRARTPFEPAGGRGGTSNYNYFFNCITKNVAEGANSWRAKKKRDIASVSDLLEGQEAVHVGHPMLLGIPSHEVRVAVPELFDDELPLRLAVGFV